MNNPTKELRGGLDELGVEHFDHENGEQLREEAEPVPATSWRVGNASFLAVPDKHGTFDLWIDNCTPEQAIAATVGERNPDGLPIGLTVSNDGNLLNWVGENYVRQAIADKLNATLGAGTCRNKGFVDDGGWYFVCSKCGCEFEYGDFACEFAEGHGLGSPKFCPNCGASVVSE